MLKNIGSVDRAIRMILVLFFAYLGWSYSPWWYILAAGLLITVFTGFCWPYTWFGFNTNRKAKKARKAKKRKAKRSKKRRK